MEKEHENEVINQRSIIENVDLFSAQKYFELNLDKFGPYRINYTRNGRFKLSRKNSILKKLIFYNHQRNLLIGGAKGHVASFDWQTKKLHCELNVMERINDIKYETLIF